MTRAGAIAAGLGYGQAQNHALFHQKQLPRSPGGDR